MNLLKEFQSGSKWCCPVDIVLAADEAALAEYKKLDGYPLSTLSTRDQQRKSILGIELSKMPCPVCGLPINMPGASAAALHFGGRTSHACPCCGTGLKQVIPFLAPPAYQWQVILPVSMLSVIQELHRKGYSITGRKLRDPEQQHIDPPRTQALKVLFEHEGAFGENSKGIDIDFSALELRLVEWMTDEVKTEHKADGQEKG